MPKQQPPAKMNPAALTVPQLATVLSAAGGKVIAADVEKDLAAGAPTNADGTVHLIRYTAWLAGQVD
jgi:hypothetical protein